LRIQVCAVLHGQLGRLIGAFTAFEVGNLAATLLILRATDLLTPSHGGQAATAIALGLYTAYNVAATIASFPAGRLADRLGDRGPRLVVTGGVAAFLAAYLIFAFTPALIWALAVGFVLAGVGIGAAETAQTAAVAALAPDQIRGSAFGLLATVQAGGNVLASVIAGLLYTVASPTIAFSYVAVWMLIALIGLAVSARRRTI
jgi:MFS family permease